MLQALSEVQDPRYEPIVAISKTVFLINSYFTQGSVMLNQPLILLMDPNSDPGHAVGTPE